MSELDLFSVPPTQTSVENGTWVEYHPLTTVGDGSPIEFDISGTGEDYIDLANTMLYVQAKITKQDGNNLDANDPVGPVNLLSVFPNRHIPERNTSHHFHEYVSVQSHAGDATQLRWRR